MGERKTWSDKRAEIMSRPGAGAAYEAARLRFELGAAVRNRREELGLTQAELAERAGLKQPAVARFEAGGTIPMLDGSPKPSTCGSLSAFSRFGRRASDTPISAAV